jgi:hypothetical protein
LTWYFGILIALSPAVGQFDYCCRKLTVVQIGCGKFVAKLFVKVLENTTISGLHGSEILG